MRERFPLVHKISADTTIVLGAGAAFKPIENLTIDGTLIANESVDFFKHYSSDKFVLQPTVSDDPEALRIRGYKLLNVSSS